MIFIKETPIKIIFSLPSISFELSLNWFCVHFDSAFCVRVVVDKSFVSLLLFSSLVGLLFPGVIADGDVGFNSVHGVLKIRIN